VLATKRMWQEKRKAARKSIHELGPNIIMGAATRFCRPRTTYSFDAGANTQVALEKFALYFEVEFPSMPISNESHHHLDAKRAMEYVDEDTIGVFVILGSTFTGYYEPVKEMSDVRPVSPSSAPRAVLTPRSCSTSTRLARARAFRSMLTASQAGSSCRSDTEAPMGLQAPTCCVYQHVWPQVQAPVLRRQLGCLARQRTPAQGHAQ
jgi:hypothetical protein